MFVVRMAKDKHKQTTSVIKADRDFFQRLIVSMEAGRLIDLDALLQRELCHVPLSIATTDGNLRPANKSQLLPILESGDVTQTSLPASPTSTCVRLLSRLWQNQKKQKLSAITPMVCKSSQGQCNRVDVVFDCYNQLSIKNATRKHRAGRGHGVKCDISSRDLKLPEQWKNFFGVNENKSTLVKFLKNELLPHAQAGKKELVVSGRNEGSAASSTSRNMDHLSSIQEEADTRMVLHACEAKAKGYKSTVVISSDTDVLVLLIAFYPQLSTEVWMKPEHQQFSVTLLSTKLKSLTTSDAAY